MAASCVPIFIVLLFLSSFCKSDDDTLTQAKPLFSSDKLVSKGGDFALGFFSPTSSNTSLYLGVWYNTIPARTVVWVANRDSPIAASSSATLAITNSSDLVLSDAQGLASWATKTNIVAGGAGTAAVLLDTGNFVLRSPNGTYIWQSFDHPTDTLIPSMKFVASYGAQVVGRLIAWKSSDDPSSGDFSCGLDPTSPALQMLIRNGSKLYYRGVWNGATVSGGTYSSNDDSIVYQVNVGQGGEVSLTLNVSDGSPLTRIVLEHTGALTIVPLSAIAIAPVQHMLIAV
uniref:non-specific serine/threonine protein kinase n=1 Tax=Triticum urartu TaxID=4572 RepID=A0A8R7TMX6_TRIUA